jgi:hypothetical protein
LAVRLPSYASYIGPAVDGLSAQDVHVSLDRLVREGEHATTFSL